MTFLAPPLTACVGVKASRLLSLGRNRKRLHILHFLFGPEGGRVEFRLRLFFLGSKCYAHASPRARNISLSLGTKVEILYTEFIKPGASMESRHFGTVQKNISNVSFVLSYSASTPCLLQAL